MPRVQTPSERVGSGHYPKSETKCINGAAQAAFTSRSQIVESATSLCEHACRRKGQVRLGNEDDMFGRLKFAASRYLVVVS